MNIFLNSKLKDYCFLQALATHRSHISHIELVCFVAHYGNSSCPSSQQEAGDSHLQSSSSWKILINEYFLLQHFTSPDLNMKETRVRLSFLVSVWTLTTFFFLFFPSLQSELRRLFLIVWVELELLLILLKVRQKTDHYSKRIGEGHVGHQFHAATSKQVVDPLSWTFSSHLYYNESRKGFVCVIEWDVTGNVIRIYAWYSFESPQHQPPPPPQPLLGIMNGL